MEPGTILTAGENKRKIILKQNGMDSYLVLSEFGENRNVNTQTMEDFRTMRESEDFPDWEIMWEP